METYVIVNKTLNDIKMCPYVNELRSSQLSSEDDVLHCDGDCKGFVGQVLQ